MAKIRPAKKKITATAVISPELNDLIIQRAEEFGLTRSSFIALALGDYLSFLGKTPEYFQLDGAADAYADAHDGEQLQLGFGMKEREYIEQVVHEAMTKA